MQKVTKALIKQLNQKFIKFASILNVNKPVLGAERVNAELDSIAEKLKGLYGHTLNCPDLGDIRDIIDEIECDIRLYERAYIPEVRQFAGEFINLCVATKFYLKALR